MFTVSTPCFLSFWDFRTSFFIEEAWFWGVRVGFGGREGALASALILKYFTADELVFNQETYYLLSVWFIFFNQLTFELT